jgi:photosystem II stability/assembly factor-like uncharacterized protein
MGVATDRTLYVSTDKGLFQARSNGGGYDAQRLAFEPYAPMRWPVVVDCDDPRRLYAGTSKGGMFRSGDAAQSWREINQGIIYKEIWSVAQHPRTGELYVGTGPASVFKSLDRGESWIDSEQFRTMPESIDWTFPPPPHIAHVKGLALCDSDPQIVVGALEEGWLVRSRDGGATWETLKNGTEFDSHYVAIMPDDPAVILATSGNGFYRSTDGGDSFVRCTEGLDRSYFAQPVVHPARPHVVFTAASAVPPPGWRRREGADAGFYRSEDQGLTWRRLGGGLPDHITAAPRSVASDPESPEVFIVGMTDGTVWITEDAGESFRQALTGLPPVTAVSVAYA